MYEMNASMLLGQNTQQLNATIVIYVEAYQSPWPSLFQLFAISVQPPPPPSPHSGPEGGSISKIRKSF